MFTLPSFTLSDILTFYKVVKIKTARGAELPFICISNSEQRSWQSPTHPTDKNVVISDTLWKDPVEITLNGHVYEKSWDRFSQLISGSKEGEADYFQSVKNNIIGGSAGEAGALGLYTVTVLGGVHKNMALISLTREETPDEVSGYPVTLKFKEVLQVSASSSKITVKQAASADFPDTLNSGQAQPRNSIPYDGGKAIGIL